MDVTKAPPRDLASHLGSGTVTSSVSPSSTSGSSAAAPNASTTVTAAADRLDIQPLDLAAALQILIAEVRAELPLPGLSLPAETPLAVELADLGQPANAPLDLLPSQLATPGVPGTQTPLPPATVTPAGPPTAAPSAALALLESEASLLISSSESNVPPASLLPFLVPEPLPVAPDLTGVLARPAPAVGSAETAPGWSAPSPGSGADATPAPLVAPRPGWIPLAAAPGLESPNSDPGVGMGSGAGGVGNDSRAGVVGGSADNAGAYGGAGAGLGALPPPGAEPPRTAPSIEAPTVPYFDPLESLLMPVGGRLSMPIPLTLLSSPAQASPILIRMFLQALPEEAGNPAAWSAMVTQLELTLQSALDRAVSTVEQWRDVPQVVVDAARDTRTLVMSQLSDGPPNPLWLRPEWMWLTPRMEGFRRRRRLARRGLTDPDLWARREDELGAESVRKEQDGSGDGSEKKGGH